MDGAVELTKADDSGEVMVGIAVARGVTVGPSAPELEAELAESIRRAQGAGDSEIDPVRSAVRGMLRHGRYKPTGRAKPASEYLLGAAREGRFPRINNLVDINNLVSLSSLLPVSIVDLARSAALEPPTDASRFIVRRGRVGESYVFNDAGQSIELSDLLLVARLPGDVPCANPVKDSMATKVAGGTRDALGVIYAPRSLEARLGDALGAFGDALRRWSGASDVATRIV
jgi:DNA/RNA-binding domain of Phe-tRNA-synthetase-like protein